MSATGSPTTNAAAPQNILVGTTARPLAGQTALVTGASRGIGAAIARAFAAAGADVAISYSASESAAQEVVKSIEAAGQRGFAIKADHSKQEEVVALVQTALKKLGKIDILVNNAGVAVQGAYTDPAFAAPEKVAEVQRMWTINVTSVATAVRTVAPHLASGGRILTIGSNVGSAVPWPGLADYAATKSALQSYTKGWARDFGPKGVTVNLIQPGPIDTDMNPKDGPMAPAVKQLSPLGRHGRPEEVAATAVFLASPSASYITGAVVDVQGGLLA